MKLVVIDGNSIVNRAFFGVRMLNAPDGTPTNAIFGFLNILRRIQTEEEPDALCVTFDLPEPTFRHLKYDGYKATRHKMPEELALQMPLLKETLDAMNIRRYELAGWEADDLLGTISRKCADAGWECVVCTGDKDSLQLVNDTVTVRLVTTRMGQTTTRAVTPEVFREEYGFDPIHMIDLKALMGDASDNIPGVRGVGEKTALALIQLYHSVENLYDSLPDICQAPDKPASPGLVKKLTEGREQAALSKDLATIRCEAPLAFSPEENRVTPVDNDALYRIFDRLGFVRLMEQYRLTPPVREETEAEIIEMECVSVEVTDAQTLEAFQKAILAHPVAVRFAQDMSVCCVSVDAEGDGLGFILREGTPVWRGALEALCDERVQKEGHEVKDTVRRLLEMGIESAGWVFDAALAAYLIDPTAGNFELGNLCRRWCGFTPQDGAEEDGQFSLLDDGTKLVGRLLSEAAGVSALREALEPKLKELGLTRLFREAEMPLCPVLARMELAGFLVDRTALANFGQVLSAQIETLTGEIYKLAGTEFNINSPKQLGEVLFVKLGLPAGKKNNRGFSTNAEVLEKLRPLNPVVGLVLEYRELSKLKSTYADGLTKVIAPDGRIHTNFQMTATATGRLSSTEPNLQNIPIRRELGGEIRKMFVAPEGRVLVDADYSQIELRVLAHISGDENMRNAFLTGEDVHRSTAAQVLGIPPEQVTPEQRRHAKAVNFGIVYGISAFSLSEDIGVSVQEARAYINTYMSTYRGVAEYMEQVVRRAKETGVVTTLYGRRRPLPELKASSFTVRSFGERVARNMPIQGTAADIMKIAMVNVDRALRESGLDASLLLQVHDELIVECAREDAQAVKEILVRQMEGAAALTVPLTVEAHAGRNWYEAK